MEISPLKKFACPVDRLPLVENSSGFKCKRGHTFDRAREGYYNFLLVQNKKTLHPGDNKEMVASRRRFLNIGYYRPIADAVYKMAKHTHSKNEKNCFRLLDAGCGEGYYLNRFLELALKDEAPFSWEAAGIDISKWAIKAASKRNDKISWAVASNRNLPFFPGSIDLIVSIFGFPFWDQFSLLQSEEGFVLVVDPGENHLIELRKIIYSEVKSTGLVSLQLGFDHGYSLVQEQRLQFQMEVKNRNDLSDLLNMTPHAFRISVEGSKALDSKESLIVTVDVSLRLLKK